MEEEAEPKRWRAIVYYRTDNGLAAVTHEFEELHELHLLVECGPNWDCIDRIEVRLSRPYHAWLTVEEAEAL
jgi:hypothetical protein